MPRIHPKSIENVPLKDIRIGGIVTAADLVLKKKYKEAKKVFEKILEISPNDPEVMNLLANVYIIEGKYSAAERWLDKVLLIEPKNPQALYHLGVVYHEKGKFEKAIEMYQEAIEHYPKNKKQDIADAFQNLGCSLWEVRRREEGLAAWKTSLKFNPKLRIQRPSAVKSCIDYLYSKFKIGQSDVFLY